MLSRRAAVLTAAAALTLPAARRADPRATFLQGVQALEAGLGTGARIGVRLVDPVTGRSASYRATERFPMCSTFKLPLVAMVLHRADRGVERLSREIAIPTSALLPNSPTTTAHAGGKLSIGDLCEAAITRSDNAAANLLLETLGGPPALTRFLRAIGDPVSRLDRIETDLNEGAPCDLRDTTSPAAMLDDLRRLATGPVLTASSRKQLIFWLANNTTGTDRLRKGLPATWSIGDKTGAGGHGSNNEVALIWPPGRDSRRPVFATIYITGGAESGALARNPIQSRIGELIAAFVGPA